MANPRTTPDLLEALSDEDPEDRAALEAVWDLLGEDDAAQSAQTDAAWTALSTRLDLPQRTSPKPVRRGRAERPAIAPTRSRNVRFAGAIAFALVLAVAAGVAMRSAYVDWAAPVVVRAAPATTLTETLPDGSEVLLAADSELTYRRGFGTLWRNSDVRGVALKGEAFFDVQSGEVPFVVSAEGVRVEVLGTRFNVRARPNEAASIVLEEGSVRVLAGENSVVLTPGQETTIPFRTTGAGSWTSAPSQPVAAHMVHALAWRTDGLSLANIPLANAFDELERRYGMQINAPGVDVSTRVTAYYTERPELRTVLGDICAANGLRFRVTSRGATILPPAQQQQRADA